MSDADPFGYGHYASSCEVGLALLSKMRRELVWFPEIEPALDAVEEKLRARRDTLEEAMKPCP